jgi:ubiquinone/menaquinone biosynthesis C-methylase UbiE
VLEVACGTGLVTRRLREHMDPARRLFASDISKAMLDYARKKLIHCEGIEWREADAASLPFDAGEFSAVVCAFGVMFVPDKRAVFRDPNHWECWLRDPDGYTVVLASPDGSAG